MVTKECIWGQAQLQPMANQAHGRGCLEMIRRDDAARTPL